MATIETLGFFYIWDYFVCINSLISSHQFFSYVQLGLLECTSTKLQVIGFQVPQKVGKEYRNKSFEEENYER